VTHPSISTVDDLLRQRLIICVGCGGVGKTTTAAGLALAGALRRQRTAVITVDPARRLKDALGLRTLSTQPTRIMLENGSGTLEALALDTKRTFDALIARVAPSEEVAKRIFANRLYQELSNEFGGSTEYMAMEKLHELLDQDAYELIVVDTPPSAHARDLITAPVRLIELLASSAVRFLKAPAAMLSGMETGFARMTLNGLFKVLQRWTGFNVLEDLSDFAANFEHLEAGFRSRAAEVAEALRQSSTSFVLISTPEPDTVATTLEFYEELRKEGLPIAGVIANRVYSFPPLGRSAGQGYPESLRKKLLTNYADFAALSARDEQALTRLQSEIDAPVLATLPVLEEPPASFPALRRFAELLSGG